MRPHLPILALSLLLSIPRGGAAGESDALYGLNSGPGLIEVGRLRLDGDVFRPAGLAVRPTRVYLASTEVLEEAGGAPRRGRGHLFVFNRHGERQHELRLGDETFFRPGGISLAGERLWIPLTGAPDLARTRVVTCDLAGRHRRRTRFEVAAALSCLVADPGRGVLHGFSRDGRKRYTFSTRGKLIEIRDNPDGFLLYRDGALLPDGNLMMAGSQVHPLGDPGDGVAGRREGRLSGLAIQTGRARLALLYPLALRSSLHRPLAGGPFALTWTEGGPRLHFAPDRAAATVYTLAPRAQGQDIGPRPPPRSWGRVSAENPKVPPAGIRRFKITPPAAAPAAPHRPELARRRLP